MSSLRLLSAMAPYGGLFPRSHAATPSDAIVPAGLVGWWTMDVEDVNFVAGTVVDRSGNGGVGSLANIVTSNGVQGQIGQALKFNGSNADIDIPSSPALSPSTNLAISVWLNFTSGGVAFIVCKDNGTLRSYSLYINGGTVNLQIFGGGSNSTLSSVPTYSDGKWHHVVGTYSFVTNGTSIARLYVDGALVRSAANLIGPINVTAEDVFLGNRPVFTGFYLGTMDDVRIYNRVLDQGEILQLYSAGLAGLAYWPSSGQMAALDPSTWGYDPDMPAVIRQQTLLSA